MRSCSDQRLAWWVIQTDRGFWIEQCQLEPDTAVRGPYDSHAEALDAMYCEEQGTTRALAIVLAVVLAGTLIGGGAWVLSKVGGAAARAAQGVVN